MSHADLRVVVFVVAGDHPLGTPLTPNSPLQTLGQPCGVIVVIVAGEHPPRSLDPLRSSSAAQSIRSLVAQEVITWTFAFALFCICLLRVFFRIIDLVKTQFQKTD